MINLPYNWIANLSRLSRIIWSQSFQHSFSYCTVLLAVAVGSSAKRGRMALRKSSKPHSVVLQSMHFQVANLGNWLMPSSQPRGPPRRTRFQNPLDFTWISDFRMDFWISKGISGFPSGFLDFKVDFWISKWISGLSKWISGFQSGFLDFKVDFWISSRFLDFKWISGFHLNRYYSERTAKIYSWFLNCIPLSLHANRIQSHQHFTAT